MKISGTCNIKTVSEEDNLASKYSFTAYERLAFEYVYSENQGPIMILDKLSDLSNKLSSDTFLRIHKSYLINIRHITKLVGNRIFSENHEIPVGQTYKEELLQKMKRD